MINKKKKAKKGSKRKKLKSPKTKGERNHYVVIFIRPFNVFTETEEPSLPNDNKKKENEEKLLVVCKRKSEGREGEAKEKRQ